MIVSVVLCNFEVINENLVIMKPYFFATLVAVLVDLGFPALSQEVRRPYLTPQSKVLNRDISFSNLYPVSDGKFVALESNSSFGYGVYLSMWKIDGTCISEPVWSSYGNHKPVWDSGVCVVKDPKSGMPVIINDDGTVKRLGDNVTKISPFVDGVSVVKDGGTSYYINPKGEKIYPHLTESKLSYGSECIARRLKCGRRAYYSNKAKAWGFIDDKGAVVIPAQYREVKDFSNGYALVLVKVDDWGGRPAFIDESGKVVCEFTGSYYSLSSVTGISDVSSNGIYTVDVKGDPDCTKYFSIKPHRELYSASWGLGFVGGYAFMLPSNPLEYRPDVYDGEFQKVGTWNTVMSSEYYYSKPSFCEYGLLTMSKLVVTPKGKALLAALPAGFIGEFSEEGLAPFGGYLYVDYKGYDPSGVFGLHRDEIYLTGYCRPSGEIVIAFAPHYPFDQDVIFKEPEVPADPEWLGYHVDSATSKKTGGPDKQEDPNDPEEDVLMRVEVVATPPHVAQLTGTGEYEKGDTLVVTEEISDEWEFDKEEIQGDISRIEEPDMEDISDTTLVQYKYVVNGSGKVERKYRKKYHHVYVVASPSYAADLTGTGNYKMKDTLHVTEKIADGWKFESEEIKGNIDTTEFREEYVVRGPGKITRKYVKLRYKVVVEAKPAKKVKLTGTGFYKIGDTVTVSENVPDGWAYIGEKIDGQIKSISVNGSDKAYVVEGDGTITRRYIEKVNLVSPTDFDYRGTMPIPQFDGSVLNVPIWLELDSHMGIVSPYGYQTYGYLVVAHNPDTRLHLADGKNAKKEILVNAHMAPMLVTGVYNDETTGKQYLMVDGGEFAYGNISLQDGALSNLLMMFSGLKDFAITPARYRIEIAEGRLGDPQFTFGKLERLSADEGWLPGGHEIFTQTQGGFLMETSTTGFSSKYFDGKVMRKSKNRPDIWWYPTLKFYGIDGLYDDEEKMVKSMEEVYRTYKSDIDMIIEAYSR